jgi:LPXTG-site transpeptidase (sortase) family protein
MSIANLEAGTVQVPTLPSGGSISFTVTATVSATSGSVTNTFSATPPVGTTDPSPASVSDTDTVTQNSDLSIAKTVSNPTPLFESNVTFTVTVSNIGPGQATNVVVTDQLPTGLTFVSSTVSQGTYTSSSGVWTVGTINSGANATLTITVKVTALGTLTNTARVTSADQPDPVSANNSVSVTVGAVFDPPSVVKTINAAGLPELEWKMVWINSHNTVAIGVQVADPIPAGTTYSPDSVVCTARGSSTTTTCIFDAVLNRIFWQGNIGPDVGATTEETAANEVVITFRTSVGAGVTSVSNTATATTDTNGDGNFTSEPTTSTTNSNIATWQGARLPNTGEEVGTNPQWAYLLFGSILVMMLGGGCLCGVFLSRHNRPWILLAAAAVIASAIACAVVGASVLSTSSSTNSSAAAAHQIALSPTAPKEIKITPTAALANMTPTVESPKPAAQELPPATSVAAPTMDPPRPTVTATPRSTADTTSIKRILMPLQGVSVAVKFVPFDGFTWRMDDVKTDVAWLGGTSSPGLGSNTVLAGHVLVRNVGRGPFFNLDRLKRGEEIKLYTEKNIYTYATREHKIVDATAVDVTYPSSKPQLTLITCTEWDSALREYTHRLVVIADLVKVEPLPTASGR